MITVPTERPDADAPTPQNGVEQTAGDQPAKQQQPPQPPESSTSDTVASVVTDVVGTAVDIFFSIFD
jgi:hypothetical protein